MTAAEAVTLFVAGSTRQRGGRKGGAKDAKGSERGEAPEVSGSAPVHRDFGCAARERAVPPRPSRRLGGLDVAGFVDAEGAEEAQRTRRGPSGARRPRFRERHRFIGILAALRASGRCLRALRAVSAASALAGSLTQRAQRRRKGRDGVRAGAKR